MVYELRKVGTSPNKLPKFREGKITRAKISARCDLSARAIVPCVTRNLFRAVPVDRSPCTEGKFSDSANRGSLREAPVADVCPRRMASSAWGGLKLSWRFFLSQSQVAAIAPNLIQINGMAVIAVAQAFGKDL